MTVITMNPTRRLPLAISREQPGCPGVAAAPGWQGNRNRCGKIPADDSTLCPKCKHVAEYLAGEPARRAAKASLGRAYRQEQERLLATSPLAAVNPRFDDSQVDNPMRRRGRR